MAAEAIARGAGVEAVSVDSPAAPIKEHVDVLFIGGALYAYGLDKHLKEYLKNLDPASRRLLFSLQLLFRSMHWTFCEKHW